MKICICDDNPKIHNELLCLLESFSLPMIKYKVTSFFSGEELVENYIKGDSYDVIFLDIKMNHLDGIKAAETIRKKDSNAIIIFISSYPKYVFDVFRFEALHFLVKPISPREFNDVFYRGCGFSTSVSGKAQQIGKPRFST